MRLLCGVGRGARDAEQGTSVCQVTGRLGLTGVNSVLRHTDTTAFDSTLIAV